MTQIRSTLLALGLALLPPAQTFGAVLTFDDFPLFADEEYGPGGYWTLQFINNESLAYGGVNWQSDGWFVAGDQFIPRNQPDDLFGDNTKTFGQAHSGHFFLFNGWGGTRVFETSMYLSGVWLARPREGNYIVGGATNVTISALSGTNLLTLLTTTNVLASVSIALPDTTPRFVDTSAFLGLRGVTAYRFQPASGDGNVQGYFVADDFQFTSRSLAELCPCDGPWRSHGEFVRCFHRAVVALVKEDALTEEQASNLLKAAVRSDCGSKR